MIVYDITTTKDPAKTYSKTISEEKCGSFEDYIDKVERCRNKIERGIYCHKGNFYYCKITEEDLTVRHADNVLGTVTTVSRKIKLVWSYVFIK